MLMNLFDFDRFSLIWLPCAINFIDFARLWSMSMNLIDFDWFSLIWLDRFSLIWLPCAINFIDFVFCSWFLSSCWCIFHLDAAAESKPGKKKYLFLEVGHFAAVSSSSSSPPKPPRNPERVFGFGWSVEARTVHEKSTYCKAPQTLCGTRVWLERTPGQFAQVSLTMSVNRAVLGF